jgi:hypothetical protein
MVKSSVSAMPKRRKVEVDPQLLKEIEDLRRRMRETDREIEAAIQRAHETQLKLRKIYGR